MRKVIKNWPSSDKCRFRFWYNLTDLNSVLAATERNLKFKDAKRVVPEFPRQKNLAWSRSLSCTGFLFPTYLIVFHGSSLSVLTSSISSGSWCRVRRAILTAWLTVTWCSVPWSSCTWRLRIASTSSAVSTGIGIEAVSSVRTFGGHSTLRKYRRVASD